MRSGRTASGYLITRILPSAILILTTNLLYARMGGAGGHGGGGSYGSGSGSSSGSGLAALIYLFIEHPILCIIVIAVVAYLKYKKTKKDGAQNEGTKRSTAPFPLGLDNNKITHSFMAIQDAWQRKDLGNVRKWISDGMYQRLITQFKMMNALGQTNTLDNIRINNIQTVDTYTDGQYQIAEVAISFTMDDSFTSTKYPEFNEVYTADNDTEFWTFIKRTDNKDEKNLYDNNNCPNCGALFEIKMGEISRCSNCGTLTNTAAYDWVLCEITQQADHTGRTGLSDDKGLKELMQEDAFFAVQRMEDLASNFFMQIMEVLNVGDKDRLGRFAEDDLAKVILHEKENTRPFVFDRLYINDVTLKKYDIVNDVVKLNFAITASYRRVSIAGSSQLLDSDIVTHTYTMELSRSKNATLQKNETVSCYECSSCGAPYTDTTEDKCSYCDAPVIDKKRNWVLTAFNK